LDSLSLGVFPNFKTAEHLFILSSGL